MLDEDLARLYGVPTKRLNEAVKRNRKRFPSDFMFALKPTEVASLRSHMATSKPRGGRRYLPHAFTEQGIAMLSSVLNSERAVTVNIEIMRTFVRLRKEFMTSADLAKRLRLLESEMARHSATFGHHKSETLHALKVVFETLKALAAASGETEPPAPPVGFELTRQPAPR